MIRFIPLGFLGAIYMFAGDVRADENLKTPYVMLDPNSIPVPSDVATSVPLFTISPDEILRFPSAPALPAVHATSDTTDGAELVTIANSSTAMVVHISPQGNVGIRSLRSNITGFEYLSSASSVFTFGGPADQSSEAYRLTRWSGIQYPEYAELIAEMNADASQTARPKNVLWRVRAYRTRPYIEQQFEFSAPGVVVGQVLHTKPSLKPVMPANLFARGFSNGKPNIRDRRRFEYTEESDHLCFDEKEKTGLWAFVADTGGQVRVAPERFAQLRNVDAVTSDSLRTGAFIIQPFHGPPETGFASLRDYIQRDYSIQGFSPPVFEWNQFWLWMGGPVSVDYNVVTEKRLLDVLPRVVKLGLEEFHLDAGWQRGPGDWTLDPVRFPSGWKGIRDFNRRHRLAFHLWVNDAHSNSSDFLLDLIQKSGMNRLFIDRRVTDATLVALQKVRDNYPGLSVNVHNSTSRSAYWPWGNLHFLNHLNQVYFGEGEFWAWSNILPEANVEPRVDPAFPQLVEAERFFSRHNLAAGDLITRAAAYQAHWVWPFNAVMPPHSSWDWFEKRPLEQLKHRALTYLACKWKYEWGFDPRRLTPEAINFHQDCTAWFKVNRNYLTVYQHVLNPPDGSSVDAAGHVIDGKGYVFLFNPSDQEQHVEWKQILWEPELNLGVGTVSLSDWSLLTRYETLPEQNLLNPSGSIRLEPHAVRVIGLNLDCMVVQKGIQNERRMLQEALQGNGKQ